MLILLFNFAKGGQQPQADEKLLLEKFFIGNNRYYATNVPCRKIKDRTFFQQSNACITSSIYVLPQPILLLASTPATLREELAYIICVEKGLGRY